MRLVKHLGPFASHLHPSYCISVFAIMRETFNLREQGPPA
jgi:hypothetical protein